MILRLLLFLPMLLGVLFATELPAPWPERFAALAASRTLLTTFTEERHTPLKKRSVVVTGTVRIDQTRGLSLAYDQPRAPIVILDSTGLLLRHPDGHTQTAPAAAEADLRMLHALFTLDLRALEKTYDCTVHESPDGTWSLTWNRHPDSSATYREILLAGQATHLTRIHLIKTPQLQTHIHLAPPTLNPAFSPADLARYFR
jgi:Outer membrane lipoprotein carrier protein LolA